MGGQSVTPGAAGLLIVVFHAGGHVVVQDKPHIGFVNTHAKGVCSHDDRRLVVDEIVLVGAAGLGGQPGVVFGGGKAGLGQQLLQLIDILRVAQ